MIQLLINTHEYENDVRVMTQAFYPKEKIITGLDTVAEDFVPSDAYAMTCVVEVSGTKPQIRIRLYQKKKVQVVEAENESSDLKLIRNHLKRELYKLYHEITDTTLPWGTLTGIRPCKIPTKLLEEGYEDAFIRNHLKEEYLVSEKKAALSLAVAKNEQKLLSSIDSERGFSLYIGIPFCPTTCLYCSFTSFPISMWKDKVDAYLDALCKELRFLSSLLEGRKPDSIYIGGGTPTTLSVAQIHRLLTQIEMCFDLSVLKEFTVEAGRPDSISREKLLAIKAHEVDRISINPQTMNQRTLDLIGRKHTVGQIREAFAMAREIGFKNINMDLIVGLPGENLADLQYTLEQVKQLEPDNLTVHSLAIKRASRLNTMRERYADYQIENTDEMMELTRQYAAEMGMLPYYLYRQKNMAGNFENVGYAKPDKMGVYNILIMEERQSIFAAGANAQSKIVFCDQSRVERIENVKDVADYIARVDEMIERKRTFFDA